MRLTSNIIWPNMELTEPLMLVTLLFCMWPLGGARYSPLTAVLSCNHPVLYRESRFQVLRPMLNLQTAGMSHDHLCIPRRLCGKKPSNNTSTLIQTRTVGPSLCVITGLRLRVSVPLRVSGIITTLGCTSTSAHKSQRPLSHICSFQNNITNIGL